MVEVALTPWSSTAALVLPQSALIAGADSVSFVTQVSGATMHGGGTGAQTVASVPLRMPLRSHKNFGGGFISLGSGNDAVTFSGAGVTGTTLRW